MEEIEKKSKEMDELFEKTLKESYFCLKYMENTDYKSIDENVFFILSLEAKRLADIYEKYEEEKEKIRLELEEAFREWDYEKEEK